MAPTRTPDGVVNRILTDEISPTRFEQFCCDCLTEELQQLVVPTSTAWDLGRDGRTLMPPFIYLCVSLRDDVEDKLLSDLSRLLSNAQPDAVYFCSSQAISEHSLEHIRTAISKSTSYTGPIVLIDRQQLVALVSRHPNPFHYRYHGEVLEHRSFLLGPTAVETTEKEDSLRLALAVHLNDDATELRNELLRGFVLRSLNTDAGTTRTVLAKRVSDSLRLPKKLSETYLDSVIKKLEHEELVTYREGGFWLEAAGVSVLSTLKANGQQRSEVGRETFRRALEELLGDAATSVPFEALWTSLQDVLANFFYLRGVQIVQCLSSLTEAGRSTAVNSTYQDLLDQVRTRVLALLRGSARAEAVAQAIIDILQGNGSSTSPWIEEVAVKYVCLCSLGLDPGAQAEIAGLLRGITIVADTDVVLSHLSSGERPHEAINAALQAWHQVGGPTRVVPPVLEEAAYHAWISQNEYLELERLLPSLQPAEIPRYAKNAFVRGYWYACRAQLNRRHWEKYIREYRGTKPYDSDRISAILTDEGLRCDPFGTFDLDLAKRIRDHLLKIRRLDGNTYVPKQVGDKVWRDACMLAEVQSRRAEFADSGKTMIILSSSPMLQRAARQFASDLGETAAVWPVGALAYLLSLLPGVRLSVTHLQKALFDEIESSDADRLTRLAMVVIRSSGQFTVGYSRRATLKRELRKAIARSASETGRSQQQVLEELDEADDSSIKGKAEIIAQALDSFVASKNERRAVELEAELLRVQKERRQHSS